MPGIAGMLGAGAVRAIGGAFYTDVGTPPQWSIMRDVADVSGHFRLRGEPIPDDANAVRFHANEKLSTPYEAIVEFQTEDSTFTVESCLRQRVSLEIVDAKLVRRYIDGVVDRAEFVDVVAEKLYFRLRLRPALAALAHRHGSRIFQDLTIVQVAQTIFQEAGFGDKVDWLLGKAYEPREYIVQYRESELNFVSRLLEEYGLFYWFGHTADGHTMAISDDPASFAARDDTPAVHFTMLQGIAADAEPLGHFSRRRAARTSSVHLRDYDFTKPQVPPEGKQPVGDVFAAPYFEYPGGFNASSVGSQLANARMRALRHDADVVEGKSAAIGLRCGVPFTVDGAAEPELNAAFVITELVTTGAHTEDASVSCENVFRGIPTETPFAVPQRARRPRIHGVQTAIVTGSSQQEQALHVDDFGRIKVRFHWDRVGQQDHTSSCWVRVSQVGLGGSMILPRIGWEVSIAFLDGDPDRPIALGRVYNGEKKPPYPLPGSNATASLKSWSSPGGGGFNEVSASDTGGSQGFSIHAQKDLNITIGNDKNETVAVDEAEHISVNETASVGADETIDVGGNQSLDVGENRTQNIAGGQSISVGGNDNSNATCDYVEKVDGSRSYSVGGRQLTIQNGIRHSITGNLTKNANSLQINGSIASIKETVTGSYTHDTGAVTVHLVNGNHGESVKGSKTLTSTAAELHMTKANLEQSCDASVTNLVGGLHYQKLDGDLVIKAPIVTLLGAVGIFSGGGSTLKLGGSPIVAKGSKIAIESAMIVKMGSSLKMG
jgi:type VI secretion system secreted protein VgrG